MDRGSDQSVTPCSPETTDMVSEAVLGSAISANSQDSIEMTVDDIATHDHPKRCRDDDGGLEASKKKLKFCRLSNMVFEINSENESGSKNDFLVASLLSYSDNFIKKAHSIVLSTSSQEGFMEYSKLIMLAIKSLLILLKRYSKCLNPSLESYVNYKLAILYFKETRNLNRSEDYANRSYILASRNNLIQLKLASELLLIQILEKSNIRLSTTYAQKKFEFYMSKSEMPLAALFRMSKFKALSFIDVDSAVLALQAYTFQSNSLIEILFSLYKASFLLYTSNFTDYEAMCDKIEANIIEQARSPIQFTAMLLLIRYAAYIYSGEMKSSKSLMYTLNEFILEQQKNSWINWNDDGTFPIEYSSDLVDQYSGLISLNVQWLNSNEFVILFYMLMAIDLLSNSQASNKSKKVLERTAHIIQNQLSGLNKDVRSTSRYGLANLRSRKLRLQILEYNIKFYTALLEIRGNSLLFARDFDNLLSTFSSLSHQETFHYSHFLAKLLYLYGLRCHYIGSMGLAKLYYMKAYNFTSKNQSHSLINGSKEIGSISFDSRNALLQPTGASNELNLFSVFQLRQIYEYEISLLSSLPTNQVKVEYKDRLLQICNYFEGYLENIFGKEQTKKNLNPNNLIKSNSFLNCIFKIFKYIYTNSSNSPNHRVISNENFSSHLAEKAEQVYPPYIRKLLCLVDYLSSRDLSTRQRMFDESLVVRGKSITQNELIVDYIILEMYLASSQEAGHKDKSELIRSHLKNVKEKIETNTNNAKHSILEFSFLEV